MRQLADAGIDTGVMMMPLVPGITTSRRKIGDTLRAIRDTGARFVGANVARLDPGVREHFFAFLEREYPGLSDAYARLYQRKDASRDYVSAVKSVVRDERQRLFTADTAPSAP